LDRQCVSLYSFENAIAHCTTAQVARFWIDPSGALGSIIPPFHPIRAKLVPVQEKLQSQGAGFYFRLPFSLPLFQFSFLSRSARNQTRSAASLLRVDDSRFSNSLSSGQFALQVTDWKKFLASIFRMKAAEPSSQNRTGVTPPPLPRAEYLHQTLLCVADC
jgi:hypothetical protein